MTENNREDKLVLWLAEYKRQSSTPSKLTVPIFDFPSHLYPHHETSLSEKQFKATNGPDSGHDPVDPEGGRGLTCLACGIIFDDRRSQHLHFKTELHRLNLKRRLAGFPPLTDANMVDYTGQGDQYNKSADGAGSTEIGENAGDLSEGSDGEKDSYTEDSPDCHADDAGEEELLGMTEASALGVQTAFQYPEGFMWTRASGIDGMTHTFRPAGWEWHVTIPECVMDTVRSTVRDADCSSSVVEIENPWVRLQEQANLWKDNSSCAVLLLRSGRFAGAIFDRGKILVHKVMRRYTVRAKAGGGQASHDNKGRKAKSMGAQLRRYGEQALKEDVRATLIQWAGHLQCCHKIFISAPKTMRGILFSDDSNAHLALRKSDHRLANVGFHTGRPTLEEVNTVYRKCTSAVFSIDGISLPSSSLRSCDKTLRSSDPSSGNLPPNEEPPPPPANSADRHGDPAALDIETAASYTASDSIMRACAAGDERAAVDAIMEAEELAVSSSLELSILLNLPNSSEELASPLHVAAAQGMLETVRLLLMKGSDPTARDVRDRVPYFVAKNKETRDVFRRCRAELGEDVCWDWHAAGVGAPLTEDAVQAQKMKEREKKRRQAQRKKELKKQQDAESAAAQQRLEQEQKLRAERKLAARENAGSCAVCGTGLFGIMTLEVFERRCCSTSCVQRLRRQLAADAALKRMGSSTS